MNQFVQLISEDGYNLYIPIPVACLSQYLKKIIKKAEEDAPGLIIELKEFKGNVLEAVFDYLTYKYYYEEMKDINIASNKEYPLDEKMALDILIASTKLEC